MKISDSEIIFFGQEIRSAINVLSDDVLTWLRKSNSKKLNIIPVLDGAGKFSQYFLDSLTGKKAGLEVIAYPLKIKATSGTHLLPEPFIEGPGVIMDDLSGCPVLIMDDLLDSGKTVSFVKNLAVKAGAADIKTAVLVNKFIQIESVADFVCFDLKLDKSQMRKEGIKDLWVFGFGMDLNGRLRDHEDIGWVRIR